MLFEAIRDLNKEGTEIMVPGYGRLDLETAKQSVIKRLEGVIEELTYKDKPQTWSNANHQIYKSGVLSAMIDAIVKAEKEQEGEGM